MTAFHDYVTDHLFRGSLPSWQQEPLDHLIAEGQRRGRALEDVAYVLATAYHETARFKYMHEIGEGRGRDYGTPLTLIRGSSAIYFGRGFAGLTWLRNYALMSVFLTLELGRQVDLVNNPDLAAQPDMAAAIIWEGMIRGFFTSKNLADYITPAKVDYVNARRIVNGTDKAELIAGHAETFERALMLDASPKPEGNPKCALGRSDCPAGATA